MIKELKPIGDEYVFSALPVGKFFEFNCNVYLKVDVDLAFNCDTELIDYKFTPSTKVRRREFILKEV